MRPTRILALAAAIASAAPVALAAQHCWPTAVVIVLRDRAGRLADASRADEVTVSPSSSPKADFSYGVRRLEWSSEHPPLGVDTLPSLVWIGRGQCAIDITEVTVRRGGRTMRLLADVHVNSLRHPGPSTWVIDTPPFRAGTYRLALCTLPHEAGSFPVIPASAWVRSSAREAGSCPPSP